MLALHGGARPAGTTHTEAPDLYARPVLNIPVVRVHRPRPTMGFYVRAGSQVGFGHLSRCVSLAGEVRRRGWRVRFYSPDDLSGAGFFARYRTKWTRLANERSAAECLFAGQLTVLVVDVPRRNETWLSGLAAAAPRLAVVDDVTGRSPHAWLLVNGHILWGRRRVERRQGRTRLLGTHFMLLGRPWQRARSRFKLRHRARRMLVTFGGSDPRDLVGRLVPRLAREFPSLRIAAVIGPGYRGRLAGTRTGLPGVTLKRNLPSILPEARRADLAVCAVGVTMYELACLGVPTVMVDETPFHKPYMRAMEARGVVLWAKRISQVPNRVRELLGSFDRRRSLSRAGRRHVDGQGAERVARWLHREARA